MKATKLLADHLRRRREALGLTLQEVSRRAAELDERVPISTLSGIERGALDPGVSRLFVLLRIYKVDPLLAADLAEMARRAVETPSGDFTTLMAETDRFWKAGDISRTLSHIFAVLLQPDLKPEQATEKRKALLFSAIVARAIGKVPLAKRIVDDLLCQPLEGPFRVDALVLASALWRASGSLEVALAMIARAAKVVDPEDRRRLAIVRHQEAKLELERGDPGRAEELLAEALEAYRASGDTLNEARARVLRIEVLEKLGRVEDAIQCGKDTIAFADEKDFGLVKVSAYLGLGRAFLVRSRLDEAIEELRRALASAVLLGATGAEREAHALLAQAFEAQGDANRANAERERAEALWRWAGEGESNASPSDSFEPAND